MGDCRALEPPKAPHRVKALQKEGDIEVREEAFNASEKIKKRALARKRT